MYILSYIVTYEFMFFAVFDLTTNVRELCWCFSGDVIQPKGKFLWDDPDQDL